jgi:hypothetical protein
MLPNRLKSFEKKLRVNVDYDIKSGWEKEFAGRPNFAILLKSIQCPSCRGDSAND